MINSQRPIHRVKQRLLTRLDDILLRCRGGCNASSRWYQQIEATIPSYQLPEVLMSCDGTRIADAQQWSAQRRPEILELFRTFVYGRAPVATVPAKGLVVSKQEGLLGGIATLKEVRVELCGDASGPVMTLLLFLPNPQIASPGRKPVFVGLNFFGNQTLHSDPKIPLTTSWVPNDRHTRGLPPERLRGLQCSGWPVEFILQRGYGLATAYCGEIVPDRPDGLDLGILHWYQTNHSFGKSADSWGAIAGWAWGLSRAMDYLVQDDDVAANHVVVMGHSRLGKAALWAGAVDERFAMVISNESGCGGAALFRRRLRETISIVNRVNPHWFCHNFTQYNDNEAALPVDQHMLLSLIAPRPLYISSAQLDLAADPMGEFLAAKHASRLYRLLGTSGLPAEELPPADAPVMGQIGYHMRKGRHAITLFDWMQFVSFADKHFRRSAVPVGLRPPFTNDEEGGQQTITSDQCLGNKSIGPEK